MISNHDGKELQMQEEMQKHMEVILNEKHLDEMFMEIHHILFEKIDQNYLFQRITEQSFQTMKSQIIMESR
jgi:hypothetical protein